MNDKIIIIGTHLTPEEIEKFKKKWNKVMQKNSRRSKILVDKEFNKSIEDVSTTEVVELDCPALRSP